MMQLVQELGRTAFHIVNGMPTPSFVRLNTLRRFERLLLATQEDRKASALLRSKVPEPEPTSHPTPHDVARGLVDFVPLRFQLRADESFRPFSRGSALAFIASRRDEARVEGLQGLAAPLSLAGAEYMVHYLRGPDGVVVGHL